MKFNNNPHPRHRAPENAGEVLRKREQSELPMEGARGLFIESVKNNLSTILVGETGSGKTTRGPVFLLEDFPEARIICTSPRVIPALSVSEYVANGRDQELGQEVGVITRQERKVSDETRLTFMTDGVLLSMLKKDSLLLDTDIVMVDEAHERSLNIDLCLGLLKLAQKEREEKGEKPLKIVVASATMDEEKFSEYFDDTPPLKVPGRMYPVGVSYVPLGKDPSGRDETEEFAAAKLVEDIVSRKDSGDILIFMPGEEEIKKTIQEISLMLGQRDDVEVLPLYAALPKQEQKKVFNETGKQKVIVSTNVAETSLTIPGVRHVIDTGTVKQMTYNENTGINELRLIKTPQANMNQRTGRAGRTAPGSCYRLMDKIDFEMRPLFQHAEILRENLEDTVLRMKDMGIHDVASFPFIDKPSSLTLWNALDNLKKLGALDAEEHITDMGKEMAHLQLRPDLSRMLIEAQHLDCLETMVDLCSIFTCQKSLLIYKDPNKAKTDSERNKIREQLSQQDTLRVPDSDLLTVLNVWRKWEKSGYSRGFAFSHLLNQKALDEIGLTRMQLLKNLASAGIEVDHDDKEINKDRVVRAILAGQPNALFYSNDLRRRYYEPLSGDYALRGAQIFPGSELFKSGHQLMLALNVSRSEKKKEDEWTGQRQITSTLYARLCHAITPEDIEKALPGSVTEKKEGNPTRSLYGDGYYQIVGIYILGVRIGEKRVEVAAETVEQEPFRRDHSLGSILRGANIYNSILREEKPTINELSVQRLVPDIHSANQEVIKTVKSYMLRSGDANLIPLEKQKQLHIYEHYMDVIEKNNIRTKEDLNKHMDKFSLFVSDFIPANKISKIEKEAPLFTNIGEHEYEVTYELQAGGGTRPYITLYDGRDIEEVLVNEVPLKEVSFIYDGKYFNNKDELKKEKENQQRQVAERIEMLKTTRMPRKERSISSLTEVKEKDVPKKEKQEMTEERLQELRDSVLTIRSLLAELRSITEKKNDRELKDRDNILIRIKEVLGDCTSLSKEAEEKRIVSVDVASSSLAKLKQSVDKIAKRVGVGPSSEKAIGLFGDNMQALILSAKRNEVTLDEALLKKLRERIGRLSFASQGVLSDDEADALIIELV